MSKKIAILGTGANGSSIGADLINAGHDVFLIDQWPEHVQAMRTRGLRIVMPDRSIELPGPLPAYNLCDVCTFRERFDIVLMVLKAYDAAWASRLIGPYLKADGLMAGVQNGMTTQVVAEAVGPERTIGCVIEISSGIFEPGIVQRHSPPTRSWFAVGSVTAATRGRESEIADLLCHAGKVEIVQDIEATKWMKLVSNASTLVPTALLGLPMYEALQHPGMRDIMLRSSQEALDVGAAVLPIFGLTPGDIRQSNRVVETLLDTLMAGFTLRSTATTVLHDWNKGRHSEVDDVNGLIVMEAKRMGLTAPVNRALVNLARQIEQGALTPNPGNLDLLIDMTTNIT
jgi:2-dehydropantoate 2-reductase